MKPYSEHNFEFITLHYYQELYHMTVPGSELQFDKKNFCRGEELMLLKGRGDVLLMAGEVLLQISRDISSPCLLR
jgi:hypothetical protein